MKILNFGSLNLDYVYQVDSFVRPHETKTSRGRAVHWGGKGLNQSIALAQAGVPVCHAGCVGPEGGALVEALERYGADTHLVRTLETPTGHAIIQVDEAGQNCILLYGGANRQIPESFVDAVLDEYGTGDLVLLQNETNVSAQIVHKAYAKGMLVALNPSPVDENLKSLPLEKVHWLILNEVEGADLTGTKTLGEIPARLLEKYPHLRIVLTLGGQGVLYRDSSLTLTHGVYNVPVRDTTGAGDVFTGFFLSGVIRGLALEECLRLASRAAAICITKEGAAESVPTLQQVEEANLMPKGE